jgi:transposase IS116/IS110/IS902 family protein
MLRNRIHRLLGAQHEVKLPQCSDLFGCKGLSFLEKLELPAPARLLLTQQLALLNELAVRIHEDEQTLERLVQETPALNYVQSLPGMGPILAAVVVSEIDGIERFSSAEEALWLRRPVSFHPQQWGQDFSRQAATTLQQMAPLAPLSRPPGLPSVARPTSGTFTNASEPSARDPTLPS